MTTQIKTYWLLLSTGLLIVTGCSNSNAPRTPAPIVSPQIEKPKIIEPIAKQVPSIPSIMLPVSPTTSAITTEQLTQTSNMVSGITNEPAPITIETLPESNNATLIENKASEQINEIPLIISDSKNIKNAQMDQAKRLVILLPDRQSLAQVNRDIVQGIKQAYNNHPYNNSLQIIAIHDDLPADQLIAKVNALAPDAIIGPLTKTDIQDTKELKANTQIILNRNNEPLSAIQMGLAPEDELQQILMQRKYPQLPIVVFTSNDASDNRMLTSLQQLTSKDDIPILLIPYAGPASDLSEWIKKEGHLQQSQQRIDMLKKTLKSSITVEPRLRNDIQAVISLTSSKNTRTIMPALRYFQVPWKLLATSRLLPSRKGIAFNEPDLDGVQVVIPTYLIDQNAPQNAFEALGWDAYQLLGFSEVNQLQGETGKLTSKQKMIYRQLEWRTIRKGQIPNWQNPATQIQQTQQP